MKKVSLLLVLIALAACGLAQNVPSVGTLAPPAKKGAQFGPLGTDVCQSTFVSGSGVSWMQFCTTVNGNVSKFESPSGWNQLYHGAEGYGLCDATDGNVGYYDWGSDGDSGWQTSTLTQPHGPNTFPLTITRTTSDGVWTLKQVFTRNTTVPSIKITMTLKNNTAFTRQIYLERFADIDADGLNNGNFFDDDQYGAWGYTGHGLMLRATTNPVSQAGGILVASPHIDPCHPSFVLVPYKGDGAIFYEWPFTAANAIAPGASRTAVFEYRAF